MKLRPLPPFVCTAIAILVLAGSDVTVTTVAAADMKEGNYVHDARFDDAIPNAPTFDVTTSTRVKCGLTCLNDVNHCDSMTYNSATGRCLGLASRTPQTAELTSAPGFRLHRRVPACPTDLGYVYHAPLNLCLKFDNGSRVSCYSAPAFCTRQQAQLAIMRDPAEINFAIGHVNSIGGGTYIIGATRLSGSWRWHDGSSVESSVLSMASTSYECLVVGSTKLSSMWATNARYVICRLDVTGF